MGVLKRIWHDPVWSKVIAGGILTMAGLFFTFYDRRHSLWFDVERWAQRSIFISRGEFTLWLSLAFTAGIFVYLRIVRRRTAEGSPARSV